MASSSSPTGTDTDDALDEYADQYHEQRAAPDVFEGWFEGWVKGISPPSEGVTHVYILVVTPEGDVMVLETPRESIYDLTSAYDGIDTHFLAAEDALSVDIKLRTDDTPDGTVRIADCPDSVSSAYDPDAIVTSVGDDDAILESMFLHEHIEHHYQAAMDETGAPLRVELSPRTTSDDRLKLVAQVGDRMFSWTYARPGANDTPTETLIEETGGGDPRFLDGSYAYVVQLDDWADDDRVKTDGEDGPWTLCPISVYEDTTERSGAIDRLTNLFS